MQAQAYPVETSVRPERAEAARPATAEPRGPLAITAFYLVAALACLAVVVGAAIAAAL
ncbi:MAG: hypothetical protein ACRDNI_02640 [Gaiellaceae bacterium]